MISLVIAAFLVGGAMMLSSDNEDAKNNVSVVDGKQIITIDAKGRYSPKVTTARADMPTIIKMKTLGTFDCTAALSIPSLDYRKNLPPSGETLITIPPQKTGAVIQGVCGMGMYNFAINFN